MTESEWLACNDPNAMLWFLRDKASDRKLRLFACSCCRRNWHLVTGKIFRWAVKVAERFADGQASRSQRLKALKKSWARDTVELHHAFSLTASDDARGAVVAASLILDDFSIAGSADPESAKHNRISYAAERASQATSLRDIIGNPFRVTSLSPSWLVWNDGIIPKLAASIYDARAFDRLPLLADALEDAGCTDADILAHCRSGGEHVRGCWVVDLLLGKT